MRCEVWAVCARLLRAVGVPAGDNSTMQRTRLGRAQGSSQRPTPAKAAAVAPWGGGQTRKGAHRLRRGGAPAPRTLSPAQRRLGAGAESLGHAADLLVGHCCGHGPPGCTLPPAGRCMLGGMGGGSGDGAGRRENRTDDGPCAGYLVRSSVLALPRKPEAGRHHHWGELEVWRRRAAHSYYAPGRAMPWVSVRLLAGRKVHPPPRCVWGSRGGRAVPGVLVLGAAHVRRVSCHHRCGGGAQYEVHLATPDMTVRHAPFAAPAPPPQPLRSRRTLWSPTRRTEIGRIRSVPPAIAPPCHR